MNSIPNKTRRLAAHTLIVAWAVGAYIFFQTAYSYTFFYKEQNQLFLLSWEYVSGYLGKEAWLSSLAGDFLTQFYYYVYAGPAVYAALILITGLGAYVALRRLGASRLVACLVGLACEAALTVFNFDPDYRTSSALSLTGTVCVLLLWTAFRGCGRGVRLCTEVVCVGAAWWLFGLGAPCIGKVSAPYSELEDYLETDCLFYFGKDEELAEKVEGMDSRGVTGVVSAYYYMSRARLGILPQSIGMVSPVNLGTLLHIGPESSVQEIKLMAEFYFLLGDMTMTERAAMIALVSSPDNRNVRMVKRLAEANLVAGDNPAAMKYLSILEKTLAYRKWAAANRPGRLNAQLRAKRGFVSQEDRLRTDDNCRPVLIGLLEANPRNRIALDYLLCTDIQVGDAELLHEDYEKYYRPLYGEAKEKLYREALRMNNCDR